MSKPDAFRLVVEVQAERLLAWLDLQARIAGEELLPEHAATRALALALARRPEVLGGDSPPRLDAFVGRWAAADEQARSMLGSRIEAADQQNVIAIARACREAEPVPDPAPVLPPAPHPGLFQRLFGAVPPAPEPQAALPLRVLPVKGAGLRAALPPGPGRGGVVLAVGTPEDRPAVREGALVIRRLLCLGLAAPAEAPVRALAELAQDLRRILENPRSLETPDQFTGDAAAPDTSTELDLPDPIPTSELLAESRGEPPTEEPPGDAGPDTSERPGN